METTTVETKKRADETDCTIDVLQVQLDATGAELKRLEVEFVLVRSEVMAMETKERTEVAVAQSEMARANVGADE